MYNFHVNNNYRSLGDSRSLEIQRDGTTNEWSVKDIPGQPISISHVKSQESLESSSPIELDKQDCNRSRAVAELKSVFNAQLAHMSYLSFFRFLGEAAMENIVKNQAFILELCYQYENAQTKSHRGKNLFSVCSYTPKTLCPFRMVSKSNVFIRPFENSRLEFTQRRLWQFRKQRICCRE